MGETLRQQRSSHNREISRWAVPCIYMDAENERLAIPLVLNYINRGQSVEVIRV